MRYRTWIEVSKNNLLHNFRVLKRVAKGAKFAAVIKANAYGHGLSEVVGILKDQTDFFAVDSLEEGLLVRRLTSKPVLVLGYIPSFGLKEAVKSDLSFVVYNLETLKKIVDLRLSERAKVHLKIETGLNRQGIQLSNLSKFIEVFKKDRQLFEIEGVSTHFANIEDTLDSSFAETQINNFKKSLKVLEKGGINPKYSHSAASAATILYKSTHFNLVRVGIGLYGLWPSREARIAAKTMRKELDLKAVLSWKSLVSQVKEIKVGESVGYGRAWIASRNTKIAIIPVGYSDGFDRKLSNSGRVILQGRYAPVIGRVAMNMIMVDVTEIPNVGLEDEVVIIGRKGKLEISANEIAEKLGTINYEIVSRLSPFLPRIIK